jgi:hypothetical protein
MAKRDLSHVPPPSKFLSLTEVAGRWRRQELTTDRLLKKFGVPVYRLGSKVHLYALADIEKIEEQARQRPPLVYNTTWKPGTINRTAANTKGQKEAAKP